MDEIIKGHLMRLRNLKGSGTTDMPFYMDPALHDGQSQEGPSTQEYMRGVIARIKALDDEKPHYVNALLIRHARWMIKLFETRALERKFEKGEISESDLQIRTDFIRFFRGPIESHAVGPDGHLNLEHI